MRIRKKSGRDRTVLSVSGNLDIYHSQELRKALIKALDDAPRTEIAIGEVSRVDLSFLQILCSADRTAKIRKKELVIAQDSLPGPIVALCRQTGFDRDEFFNRYCLTDP